MIVEEPVVLLIHECGEKEFCRLADPIEPDSYVTIVGSVGYNAVGGDINKAREQLYNEEIVWI